MPIAASPSDVLRRLSAQGATRMAIPNPKPQPALIDPAEELVQRWPRLRTAKGVWKGLWKMLGGRPGKLRINVAEVGKWVGAAEPRRSGEHLLRSLELERLIRGSGPGGKITR